MKIEDRVVAGLVVAQYRESRDFNGLPVHKLATTMGCTPNDLIDVLAGLIRERRVSIVSPDFDVNPHIKRLADQLIEKQIEALKSEMLPWGCVYPLYDELTLVVDRSEYQTK